MKVFISFAQNRGAALAEAIRDWLPDVLQAVKPFMSNRDIESGTAWFPTIMGQLGEAKDGIICLTPESLSAPWLLFEAGAIAKGMESARVHAVLFGVEPSEVKPPLGQFQLKKADRTGFLSIIDSLNERLGDAGLDHKRLEKAFDAHWQSLEHKIEEIMRRPAGPVLATASRTLEDMVKEVLDILRSMKLQEDAAAIAPTGINNKAYLYALAQLYLDTLRTQPSKPTILTENMHDTAHSIKKGVISDWIKDND
ncbi:toll/interleukin-1 receptor domain-containing protein [Dyella sp. SG609]|uniref:toll/interleukin-1 receptor domain-containing protein n=1 Tax=Dyella sp. SG609 TaxID=2587018 RepID=UPI0014464AFA|nr:toll/interleukin-1 receptor domain-containing protein [Dyella sp. SG609]NKJ23822.1 hypothetical protein [Dyella sp. SG609]